MSKKTPKERNDTRVYLKEQYVRWKQLAVQLGMEGKPFMDFELAKALMDNFEYYGSSVQHVESQSEAEGESVDRNILRDPEAEQATRLSRTR